MLEVSDFPGKSERAEEGDCMKCPFGLAVSLVLIAETLVEGGGIGDFKSFFEFFMWPRSLRSLLALLRPVLDTCRV